MNEIICVNCGVEFETEIGDTSELCEACIIEFEKERKEEKRIFRSFKP